MLLEERQWEGNGDERSNMRRRREISGWVTREEEEEEDDDAKEKTQVFLFWCFQY